MTVATRAHVHTSPRKPYASAPSASSSGNKARSAGESLGGAPTCGRPSKPALPSSRTALIHLLTARLETPRASAISSCVQSARLSSNARYRRLSFQSGMRIFLVLMIVSYHAHQVILLMQRSITGLWPFSLSPPPSPARERELIVCFSKVFPLSPLEGED